MSPANFVQLLGQCAVTVALFHALYLERGVVPVALAVFPKILSQP